MVKERFRIILALLILAPAMAACAGRPVSYRAPLEKDGELFVYLEPLARGAERLRFVLDGLSAVGHDGSEHPLALSLREVKRKDLKGNQRLLASGVIPPGTYRGLSVSMKKAYLMGEEGEGELLVPDEQVTIEGEFSLPRRQALAVFLQLDPSRSVTDGFLFTPAFALETPINVPLNLTGYITDPGANTIFVFNKKTHRIIGAIATGSGPKGIALDRRRRKAYVALAGSDAVDIVDLAAQSVVSRIRLNPGDGPWELALTPDGRTLVSANYGSGTVSIIDAGSQFETARIKVGEGPADVAIDPQGFRAFVANSLSDTLSVIDLSRKRLQGSVPVGPAPLKVSFNRSGERLYVTSRRSPDLFAVDPAALSVTGRLFVDTGAVSVEVDVRSDLVFVGNALTGEIAILDPATSIVLDSIAVDGTPSFMAIDNEERALFVVLPDIRKILKVNLVSRKVLSEMALVSGVFELAVMGEN